MFLACSSTRCALQEKWEFSPSPRICSASILLWRGPKIPIFKILTLYTGKCKCSTSCNRLQHAPSLVSIILKGYRKLAVVGFEKHFWKGDIWMVQGSSFLTFPSRHPSPIVASPPVNNPQFQSPAAVTLYALPPHHIFQFLLQSDLKGLFNFGRNSVAAKEPLMHPSAFYSSLKQDLERVGILNKMCKILLPTA